MTEEDLLIPKDTYLKAGIHIGTKYKTKYMSKFIYKTRPDGLSVLNLKEIDNRIKEAAKFLANYNPEEVLVVARREPAFKPLDKMKEMLNVKTFKGRYPPGVITNPELENFIEPKLVFVSDPSTDHSAVKDAFQEGITLLGCCDTNNTTNFLDLVIPCNNKGKKSLGLLFYLLTREVMVQKGLIKSPDDFKANVEDFTEE